MVPKGGKHRECRRLTGHRCVRRTLPSKKQYVYLILVILCSFSYCVTLVQYRAKQRSGLILYRDETEGQFIRRLSHFGSLTAS